VISESRAKDDLERRCREWGEEERRKPRRGKRGGNYIGSLFASGTGIAYC
jgi:hypothetical protein